MQKPPTSTEPLHTQGEQLWQSFLENFEPDTPLPIAFEDNFWILYQKIIHQSSDQRIAQTPTLYNFDKEEALAPYDHLEGFKTIYHKFWPFPHTVHILHNEQAFVKGQKAKKRQQNLIGFGWAINVGTLCLGEGEFFFLGVFALLFWHSKLKKRKKVPRTEEYFWFNPLYMVHKKIKEDKVIAENHIYYQDIHSVQKRGKDLRVYSKLHSQELETFIPQKVESIDKIEEFLDQIIRLNKRRLPG